MMYFWILVTIIFHFFVPFGLLYWVAFNRGRNILYRLCIGIFAFSSFVNLKQIGAWSWFGWWWPYLYLTAMIPAAVLLIRGSHRLPLLPEKSTKAWMHTLLAIVLAVWHAYPLPLLMVARTYEGRPLALTFPLRNGTYHIAHGGNGESVNHHYPVSAQKYALDILKLNAVGIRATGLYPKGLTRYAIFSDTVIAPCDGEVISVEAAHADRTPPKGDADHVLGNHVVLYCHNHSVLLAHLMKDTVKINLGALVKTGDVLGKVGNTGNTSEPHLHLHAVEGRQSKLDDIAWKAKGVPMTFGSRFLIRNDQIKTTAL